MSYNTVYYYVLIYVITSNYRGFRFIWIHLPIERICIISEISNSAKELRFSHWTCGRTLNFAPITDYSLTPAHLHRTRGSAIPIDLSPSEPRLVLRKYGRLKLKSSSLGPTSWKVPRTSLLRGGTLSTRVRCDTYFLYFFQSLFSEAFLMLFIGSSAFLKSTMRKI